MKLIRYLVLIDKRLADIHNYRNLLATNFVAGEWRATYFTLKGAENYVERLRAALPHWFSIEIRKI